MVLILASSRGPSLSRTSLRLWSMERIIDSGMRANEARSCSSYSLFVVLPTGRAKRTLSPAASFQSMRTSSMGLGCAPSRTSLPKSWSKSSL